MTSENDLWRVQVKQVLVFKSFFLPRTIGTSCYAFIIMPRLIFENSYSAISACAVQMFSMLWTKGQPKGIFEISSEKKTRCTGLNVKVEQRCSWLQLT